jgi:hypothetical protein
LANETNPIRSSVWRWAGQFDSACDSVCDEGQGQVPSTACYCVPPYPRAPHNRALFRPPTTKRAKREQPPNRNQQIHSTSKFGHCQGRPLQEGTAIRLASRPDLARPLSDHLHSRASSNKGGPASRARSVGAAKPGWRTVRFHFRPFQVAFSSFEPPPLPPPQLGLRIASDHGTRQSNADFCFGVCVAVDPQ